MNSLLWIMTGDGNINIIVNGVVKLVGTDHENYDKILAGCVAGDSNVINLIDEMKIKINNFDGVDFSIQDGELLFRGTPYSNAVLSAKILKLIAKGFQPAPLVRFLERLELNPNLRSREMLWDFLQHNGFAISDDGMIIGFKYVSKVSELSSDDQARLRLKYPNIVYTDQYSRKFNYSPGATPSIPRYMIDISEDGASCGNTGLHVGTFAYVNGSAHKILVAVDPMDVASVPKSESQKLRCVRFTCLSEYNPDQLDEKGLKEPVMKIDGTKLTASEYGKQSQAAAVSRPYVSDGDEAEGQLDNESAEHWG